MTEALDWDRDERVIVPRRLGVAIYRNLDRDIVIRQECPDGEDPCITVSADDADLVLEALQHIVYS